MLMICSVFSLFFDRRKEKEGCLAASVGFEFPSMNDRPEIETQEEVMFFDTDCAGVMHNLAYLRMIETCRTRLAALMGMDSHEMSETQLFPVLTRTEVDYKRPAKLGDRLMIRGKLGEISRVRFWCEFEVTRKKQVDVVMVTARQALALVQMPAGKPVRLPNQWVKKWG